MPTMKTLGLAIGIAFAASSFALAQPGNPAMNAARSGGPGTHQISLRTGTAENTQKVTRNLHGYGGLYAYYGSPYRGFRHRRHYRLYSYFHHPILGFRHHHRHYRLFSYFHHPILGFRHHYHHHWY